MSGILCGLWVCPCHSDSVSLMLIAAAAVMCAAVIRAACMWACLGFDVASEHGCVPKAPCPLAPVCIRMAVGTHQHGPFVVLSVLVLQEDVGSQSPHGVEEGKYGHGDKEFSR